MRTESSDDLISLFTGATHTRKTDLTPAYLKQITEDSGILRMIGHSFSTNVHNLKYVREVPQKLDKGTLRKVLIMSASSSSSPQDYSTEPLRASCGASHKHQIISEAGKC